MTQELYFDDLAIKHVKGVAIQQSDYYPFGLTYNSFQRENSLSQKYLYNGKEIQDELNLGWVDFGLRMYQTEIGKWSSIDALAENSISLTPYHYVGNNPIAFVDPNGLDWHYYIKHGEGEPRFHLTKEKHGDTPPHLVETECPTGDPYCVIDREKAEAVAQQGGCQPGVDCDDVERTDKDGLLVNTVGNLESGYSIWESNYDHDKVPLVYSRSVKGIGLGLSGLNLAIGGAQIYNQRTNGEQIDPINAAQVGVGTIGLGASLLNYLGLGGRAMARISATTGIFGMVLSIPSNWFMVYKGAYDLQYATTPYYPSDSEIFGGE